MARQLIVILAVIVGMALADDSGYGAPSSGYAVGGNSGYGAPSSPNDGYGAPNDGYGAPTYQETAPSYAPTGVEAEEKDLFNLDKLLELLPFFLAVFAAIILAQLLAPLLAMLPGVFAPFGNVKIDFINLLLSPFALAICNIDGPTIAGTPPTARMMASGFNLGTPENLDQITNFLFEAVKLYQSTEA